MCAWWVSGTNMLVWDARIVFYLVLIRVTWICRKMSKGKKPPLCKGEVGLRSKLGGVVIKENETIPQSAALTAPFTQVSLWILLHINIISLIRGICCILLRFVDDSECM